MDLFDTHFHLDESTVASEYSDKCRAAGVTYLLAVGATLGDSFLCRAFAEQTENSWFSVGVHPHDAADDSQGVAKFEEFRNHPKLVAVGEIGLDYYYQNSDRDSQRRVFGDFLELAKSWDKPVIVHCRDQDNADDAYVEAYELLRDFAAEGGRFCLHCYTGTPEWAEKFQALGGYLGYTGIVTFPRAENVRDAVRATSLDRLLVETDTPYLAPKPFRGKTNHSAYLPHIAEKVGEVHGLSVDEVAEVTTRNAFEFLGICR